MIDRQLMERYVAGSDSTAFRDLVSRHGPAVLRTCRRFVRDAHEAEDAMQATFLILVQRAPTIRDPEQLDRWLAGVARRVAGRARQQAIRRSEREHRWAELHREADSLGDQPTALDVRRAVREELGQLPAADRQPLTLCYLDGLTHEEAARRIGCPVGTIKARLVRARRRLRDRLDRRGVALGALALLLLLLRERPVAASEAPFGPTLEVMELARSGETEALLALYPRTVALGRSVPIWQTAVSRGPALALVVGLLAMIFGGGALAVLVAAERAETRRASARLTKLLDSNCRLEP